MPATFLVGGRHASDSSRATILDTGTPHPDNLRPSRARRPQRSMVM
jgi:hypothetical protein